MDSEFVGVTSMKEGSLKDFRHPNLGASFSC